MSIIAREQITLSSIRDLYSCTRYYLLQSSTLSPPAKPTTNPPSSTWSLSEPSYTAGSTNTLYTVDLNVFSDNDYTYSEVSVSSSYEAAKAAYNAASAATDAANAAQAGLDNLVIGGRNLLLGTATANTKTSNPPDVYSDWYYLSDYGMAAIQSGTDDIYTLSYDWQISEVVVDTGYRSYNYPQLNGSSVPTGNGSIQYVDDNLAGHYEYTFSPKAEQRTYGAAFRVRVRLRYVSNTGLTMTISNLKLEKGAKGTDWTPAPEDVAAATAAAQSTANGAVSAAATAQSTADGAVMAASNAQTTASNAASAAATAQSTADSAATAASNAMSAATAVDARVDNLRAGGRNLLIDSGPCHRLSTEMRRWVLTEPLENGSEYTFSAKVTMTGDPGAMTLRAADIDHPSGVTGTCVLRTFTASDIGSDGIVRFTFTYNEANAVRDAVTWRLTNTVDNAIEWAQLERGNVATAYAPAPEDSIVDGVNLIASGDSVKSVTVTNSNAYTGYYYPTETGITVIGSGAAGDLYLLSFDYTWTGASSAAYAIAYFNNSQQYPLHTGVARKYTTGEESGSAKYVLSATSAQVSAATMRLRFRVYDTGGEGATFTVSNVRLVEYKPLVEGIIDNVSAAAAAAAIAQSEIGETASALADLSGEFYVVRDNVNMWFVFDKDRGLVISRPPYEDDEGNQHVQSIYSTITDEEGFHIRREDLARYLFSAYRDRCRIENLEIGDLVVKKTSRGGQAWVSGGVIGI